MVRLEGRPGEGPTHHLLDAEFIVRESTAGIGRVPRSGVAMPLSGDAPWSAWRADQGTDLPTISLTRNSSSASPLPVSAACHGPEWRCRSLATPHGPLGGQTRVR